MLTSLCCRAVLAANKFGKLAREGISKEGGEALGAGGEDYDGSLASSSAAPAMRTAAGSDARAAAAAGLEAAG
jgi:hypothetical protein